MFNNHSTKNVTPDEDHMIPKEAHVALYLESKEFWNYILTKEKASILGRTREKPKHKHPSTRKLNKSEIEALLHQHLTFRKDSSAEDDSTSEDSIEKDASILVNSEAAKNVSPDGTLNILSVI